MLQAFERVNSTAKRIVTGLTEKGVRAINTSSGFPMDLSKWPGKMWPLSHKPIAVAAGLGVMGLHRLVIHPRFGSFIVLGTILLDSEASAYDGPLDYNPCIGCGLCVSACPVGAVGPDGSFNFTACMTHNYRDRLGGFLDWVGKVVSAKDEASFRKKVSDSESVSMWQSLSYGICNKSSYCMAVCPAGEEVIGPFLDDRKQYVAEVVEPLQDKTETIYVFPAQTPRPTWHSTSPIRQSNGSGTVCGPTRPRVTWKPAHRLSAGPVGGDRRDVRFYLYQSGRMRRNRGHPQQGHPGHGRAIRDR